MSRGRVVIGLSSSRFARVVGALASLALGFSLAEAVDAAPASAAVAPASFAEDPPPVAPPVTERPDRVSAYLTARLQGSRVEVVSSRTEFDTEYANPDGSFTLEQAGAPVRARAADGSWVPVDVSLVSDSKGLHPRAAAADVAFSATGAAGSAIATAAAGSGLVGLGWERALAPPAVAGARATYPLGGGARLEATARSTGFSLNVVLTQRPVGAPVYRFPLTVAGLTAAARADGGFDLRDERNRVVFEVAPPLMWDARVDPVDGTPLHPALVPARLVDGGQTLELAPDPGFFADPELTYPVTVDPTVSAGHLRDMYVNSANPDVTYGSSAYLKVGLHGGAKHRAFVQFDTSTVAGKHILGAQLKLREYDAGSCTPTTMSVYPIAQAWTAGQTWNTQPALNWDTPYETFPMFAHGNETLGCANATESITVTSMVVAWAAGAIPNYGFGLRADETNTDAYKAFCSFNDDPAASISNCQVASNNPGLSVTYNTKPNAATGLAVSPLVADLKSGSSTMFAPTATPTLSARATDPDGNTVRLKFEVWNSAGTTLITTGYSPYVSSGSTGSWTTSALANGSYKFRVAVYDGVDWAGVWSAWSTTFTVDATKPAAPSISCANYAANVWSSHTGSETCTLDTTSSDGAGYYWGLDTPTPATLVADSTGSGTAKSISFTAAQGWHTLYARARDRAGNLSTVTSLAFGVGAGNVLTPADGGRTQASVGLTSRAGAPINQVTYRYHVGVLASAAWLTVPAGDVTVPGGGGTLPGWPQTRAETGQDFAQLDWNVAQTIAAAGKGDGPVQIEACFQTDGGPEACSEPVTITVERTAFGASYATRDLGPGSVSLLTGDYQLSEADVSFGELSISRTHTTLAPPAVNGGASGIFGAGWTASLPGPEDTGAADYTLADHSADGHVTFTGEDGETLAYVQSGTSTTFTGLFEASDGSVLTANTVPNPTSYTLTDPDGTATTWSKTGSVWGVSRWSSRAPRARPPSSETATDASHA